LTASIAVSTKRAEEKVHRQPGSARRAIAAGVIGNLLEWYDFAVYAYLASAIAKNFFPAKDEVTSLLSTFAAFGVGFLIRPLGAIVIGRLGDLRGRKTALVVTVLMMAVGTVMIGLTPGYASIGVAAPLVVVLARLLQGFSAGGEWGASTSFIVEWAPADRRGLYGSFQQMSVAGGLLLGSAIAALISTLLAPEALNAWGWRIPFLLGGVLGPIGIYMRRNLAETPAFAAALAEAPQISPRRGAVLATQAFGFTVIWTVAYYIVLTYLPTFAHKHLGVTQAKALWAAALSLLAFILAAPLFGHWSDGVGRKPFLLACCLGFVALPYPLFRWMLAQASFTSLLVAQITLALTIALYSGPGPAAIAELFPTRGRSTWMSIGYSLAVALFGGFAPFIATWLIAETGSPITPTYYVIGAALVSTLVVLNMKESANKPLRE
jgi:MFS transporter, MHS family, proline/betaine transporter